MRKGWGVAGILVFVLLLSGLSTGQPTAPIQRIAIGVVGPLSGPNGASGRAQLEGVLLAVEQANEAGGVNGIRLDVIPMDDKGDPETARRVTQELADRGVVAVLGPINSSCARTMMDVCAQTHIPLLTVSATASALTARGNPWLFRCIESDFFRMNTISGFLVEELGVRRIAILYDDDVFGQGLRSDLEKSLSRYGLRLVAAEPFHRGGGLRPGLAEKLGRLKPDAIGLFGITPDNIHLARELSAAGIQTRLFTPGVNERYATEASDVMEGMAAVDSFYFAHDRYPFQQFSSAYMKRFGHLPGPNAGRAFDAMGLLLDALKKSRPMKGQSLRGTLAATDSYPGIFGDFNFKPNGDLVRRLHVVVLQEGQFRQSFEASTRQRIRQILVFAGLLLILPAVGVLLVLRHLRRKRRRTQPELPVRPPLQTGPLEATARTIRVNPYIVGNPVREPGMFFGREDDFQFLRQNLGRAGSGVCVVLCGDRRSGKTSILYQILNGRLGDGFLPILVDLQLYGGLTSAHDFQDRVLAEAMAALSRRSMPCPGVEGRDGKPSVMAFLERVIRENPGMRIVFLLDEYEILEGLIDGGVLPVAALDFVSGMLDRHPEISFVLTGSARLEDRSRSYWRNLISKSLYRRISYLTRRDTMRLVTEPLKKTVEFEEGLAERVYRLTAGQPFYTQALCMTLVDILNEVGSSRARLTDLEEAVELLVENPLPQMLYHWDSFSEQEKLALSLLADAASEDPGMTASQLAEHAQASSLPVNFGEESLRTALEALAADEVLQRSGSSFSFRMALFRAWILRDHTPWQLVGELRRAL